MNDLTYSTRQRAKVACNHCRTRCGAPRPLSGVRRENAGNLTRRRSEARYFWAWPFTISLGPSMCSGDCKPRAKLCTSLWRYVITLLFAFFLSFFPCRLSPLPKKKVTCTLAITQLLLTCQLAWAVCLELKYLISRRMDSRIKTHGIVIIRILATSSRNKTTRRVERSVFRGCT